MKWQTIDLPEAADELVYWEAAGFQEDLLLNLDEVDPLSPLQGGHVVHCKKIQNYFQKSKMAFLDKHNINKN